MQGAGDFCLFNYDSHTEKGYSYWYWDTHTGTHTGMDTHTEYIRWYSYRVYTGYSYWMNTVILILDTHTEYMRIPIPRNNTHTSIISILILVILIPNIGYPYRYSYQHGYPYRYSYQALDTHTECFNPKNTYKCSAAAIINTTQKKHRKQEFCFCSQEQLLPEERKQEKNWEHLIFHHQSCNIFYVKLSACNFLNI